MNSLAEGNSQNCHILVFNIDVALQQYVDNKLSETHAMNSAIIYEKPIVYSWYLVRFNYLY